jgi:tetratricopeptide (TPR) repeat protein
VLISGEAGIGKSRMTVALQEKLAAEQPIELRYFCSPHHRDSALFPFVARIERAAGFSREDTAAAKLDKLAALLSRSSDTPPEAVATFADLLGLAIAGCPQPPTDPRQRRELILGTLVGQLERLARRRPVLFIFEDAHWADSTSLELLERVAERARRLPALLILTHRPDFEPPWTGESQVTSLTLSRLGRRESAALTERVAGSKTLPTEILDRVVEHTDGIPLFIEELTKSLLEGGLLREEDGRYILADAMPALVIPSSLQDSLMARLDRLAPVKEVAQIGAAIGREFSYAVLETVARRPPDQLRDALDQLSRAGLIFRRGMPPDDVFVFKHAFVQDAAYGTLLRARRQELHAAIATLLEEQTGLSADREQAPLLAHHWIGAEDWEKALHYTLEAADRASALYARAEAINHYWQALNLFERLPENAERNRVHARVLLSTIMFPGSMRDESARARMLRHVDRALENAIRDGDLTAAVKLQVSKGATVDDEALLVDALARAEALGDVPALAFAEQRYGQYLGIHGQFEKSLTHVARSIDLMGTREQEWVETVRWISSGGRCYSARAGRLDEALAYADRVQQACDALDNPQLRAWIAMNSEPHLYRGDWAAVVRIAENALPTAWEIREWIVVVFASAWLAIAYLKLGRTADARQVLDRVFKEVPLRAFPAHVMHAVAFVHAALAQVHLASGDTGPALSTAATALRVAEQYSVGLEQGAANRVLGEVHQAMGNRDEADAAFRRSLDVLEAIQSRPELAQTLLAYGRFRRGDNRREDQALIERALLLFEEINAPGWVEEARAALAAT